jgi:hypothetical protein
MMPFSINGKVVYINPATFLALTDEEFDEEYRDLIASDIGVDVNNPFASLSEDEPIDEIDEIPEDYEEFKNLDDT